MRRTLLLVALLIVCAIPVTAQASGWQAYSNRALGFSLRYPGGWQVGVSSQSGEHLVSLSSQGRYSIQISILEVLPGKNAGQMVKRIVRYEERRGVTTFSHLHWRSTTFGRRFADVAVVGATTEGGVALSQAFYLVPGKGRTYQIMIPVNSPKPLTSVDKFPAIYRQILNTWRFL